MEKTIKQSTKDGYASRLKKLNDGKPIDNYAFLYDVNIVMDKIKELKPSTQRNYIIAIVQALRDVPIMKSMYETYTKIMDDMNSSLKINNTKSQKQTDNWVSQDNIIEVYNKVSNQNIDLFCSKRKHIGEADWTKITETLLLSLYILQPPRRILDYSCMYIVKQLPRELDRSINYYDLSRDSFVFNNYKTSGTYNMQINKAPEKLATLIECYVKIHPIKLVSSGKIPLICNFAGEPYTKTYYITKMLNRIFKRELGKTISVNMLRNIFLTDKFSPSISELNNIATAMGTSSQMAQNQYIKI